MDSFTEALRVTLKLVGPASLARWMFKHGYPFGYTYYVIFGKDPVQIRR